MLLYALQATWLLLLQGTVSIDAFIEMLIMNKITLLDGQARVE